MAVRVQWLILTRHRVKGVAGLMQQSLDITLYADGVHENKRQPRLVERALVAARRLALAVGEVQQVEVLHRLKPAGKLAVDLIEN